MQTDKKPSIIEFIAYFHKEINEEEYQKIKHYLNDSEVHRQHYLQICRIAWWIRWSSKEQQIDTDKAFRRLRQLRPRPFLYRWYNIAAILILILVLGGGILWFSPSEQPKQSIQVAQEILPIQPKAQLILSTGQTIDLSNTASVIQEENGTLLLWDSCGDLRYQSSEKQQNKIIYNKIRTPRGGEYQITLSDGTKIWLNADSQLEYPVEFTNTIRKVKLHGEAYFSVSPDTNRAFVVQVGNYRLQVYGTEFNLNTYDTTQITTVLVQGCVGFTPSANVQEIRLFPNQLGIANTITGEVHIQEVDVYPYIAWKNNDIVFVNERLESIMQKISRWYDVDFLFEQNNLKELRFYGDIKRYAKIEELLAYLEQSSQAKFIQNGRNILIRNKKPK